MIVVESRRKKLEGILKRYPGAVIADVTSKATDALVKLSPFYPHGDIPIPFTEGMTAMSVEGVWQGLKVFANSDVDVSVFYNDTMKNIKRTTRKYGKTLGHRKGVYGTELLNYIDARKEIYIPTYIWVLENKVNHIISRMKIASETKTIVLLDYEVNSDIDNPAKPLSHAYLIKAYIEGLYPFSNFKTEEELTENQLELFNE